MNRIAHIIFICLITYLPARAQRLFGNEWINAQQQYFKIPIAKTGFYEISAQELKNAGLPVAEVPANAFQLFRDGREVAIEVSETGPGILPHNGYIRFFAERNDGRRDTSLYVTPQSMPHSYYNLYSDTTFYFLTWKTGGGTGKRIQDKNAGKSVDTVRYHRAEALQLFTSRYLPGTFYPEGTHFGDGSVLTDYDVGEGWTGPEIRENTTSEIVFSIEDLAEGAFEVELEIMLAGWVAGLHSFEIYIKNGNVLSRKLADVSFKNYDSYKAAFTLKRSNLSENGTLTISIVPIHAGGHISVSYAKLSYLQNSSFNAETGQRLFYFNTSKNIWKCTGAGTNTFYDCTSADQVSRLSVQNDVVTTNEARCVIGVKEYLSVPAISRVHFPKINADQFDYLIITHPLLRVPLNGEDAVSTYASYRATTQGGGFRPLIVDIDKVYDQFNYGQRGPQGIRNLIAWLNSKGTLRFVLLVGKSIDPQKARKVRDPSTLDMVPTAGWPGSDVALAMATNSSEYAHAVPIGRISAARPQQVWDYLQKVKSVEAQPHAAEWRKNILHLSGGRSRQELAIFKGYVKSFEEIIKGSTLGAKIETISKESDDPVEYIPLSPKINRGAALITLFGHSAPDITDIDIGYASAEKNNYNNHPYYPAVIINGCAAGSIFYSDKTLSVDWIFSPKNGAVLFLAHTFNGVSTALKRYTDIFYQVLADPAFTSQPFGVIQQEAIRRNMQGSPDIYDRTTIQQMNLHGDPAIRIFPARLPDYAFDSTYLRLSHSPKNDSVLLALIVKNNGRNLKQAPALTLRRWNSSKQLIYSQTIKSKEVAAADTSHFLIPQNPAFADGDFFEFVVDEENHIAEENETNNRLTFRYNDIQTHPGRPDIVPPLLLVHIDGRQLTDQEHIKQNALLQIRIIDPDAKGMRSDTSGIFVWLKPDCEGCAESRVFLNSASFHHEALTHFYLETHLPEKLPAGKYLLTVRVRDAEGNYAHDYQIHFTIGNEPRIHFSEVYPNPSSSAFYFLFDINGNDAPSLLTIDIFDLAGRIVHSLQTRPHIGINAMFWEPANIPAGIYIYKISTQGATITSSSGTSGKDSGRLLWFP